METAHLVSRIRDKEYQDMSISIEEYGGVSVMRLAGNFHADGISTFENTWMQVAGRVPYVIAIDCKNINYLDSTAIGSLVKILRIACNKGIDFICMDLSHSMVSVFKAARIDGFFTIMTSTEFAAKYMVTG